MTLGLLVFTRPPGRGVFGISQPLTGSRWGGQQQTKHQGKKKKLPPKRDWVLVLAGFDLFNLKRKRKLGLEGGGGGGTTPPEIKGEPPPLQPLA